MGNVHMWLQRSEENVNKILSRPHCMSQAVYDSSLSESTDSRATMYRQAVMFLGLLCMLLVIANILLAVYLLQVTNRFQTQNLSLKKNCSQMSKKYKKLNNTYNEMFQKYPVLMKYCPVRDMTSNERDCQPCPERWVSFKEKCYFYSSDRLDWTASEHQCMAQGGHLVIVETEEEQAFLWEKANRRSQGNSYWIGLMVLKGNDGDWLWVDNTPLKNDVKYWGQRVSNSWNENNKENPPLSCVFA